MNSKCYQVFTWHSTRTHNYLQICSQGFASHCFDANSARSHVSVFTTEHAGDITLINAKQLTFRRSSRLYRPEQIVV